jgi:hypothetical protein
MKTETLWPIIERLISPETWEEIMQKMIVLRYASKCKKCGGNVAAGEKAIWLGKGAGVTHAQCAVSRQEPSTPKADPKVMDSHTFDYRELTEAWNAFRADPMAVYRNPENASSGRALSSDWKGSGGWVGCTEAEMSEWISRGYRVEGLQGVTSLLPAKPRRKLRFSEEGDELHIDLAWAGVDEPFSEWEKRVSKPGLSVEIFMTFSAAFPTKTVNAYQRWIARALQTLDENGVDMEVNIVNRVRNANLDSPGEITNTKIRVRKPGEAADFSNWSAMFSPGGYRMLGIMSTGIHVDRSGGRVSGGYGRPQDYGSWEVAYDPERNVIVIGNHNDPWGNTEFPEHEMTEKLQSVLAKLNG